MFELDTASGTITCAQYVLSKILNHDEFAQRYSDFQLVKDQNHSWGTEKIYETMFPLLPSQLCSLRVGYFNQNIDYIHVDAGTPPNFNWEDAAEIDWWKIQQQWIALIRPLIHSQLGVPHQIEQPQLSDESTLLPVHDLEQLKQLEDWIYRFSWGRAGLSYVSGDLSYRFWIGYKSSGDS